MAFNIDLDRGVHSRQDPQTGMDVHMYVDEPGVYRSSHGTVVDVELARRSGFPVDEQLKLRHRQQAVQAAQDKVLAELDAANLGERVVYAEREGFKVLDIGYDRFDVLSPEGDKLNKSPMGKREAVILLDQLVPPDAPPDGEQVKV